MVELPAVEFIGRVVAARGVAYSHALTVYKFNSAWRPDSYRTRRDDEQRACVKRILRERLLVERVLLAELRLVLTRAPRSLPDFGPEPEVIPPGWPCASSAVCAACRRIPPNPCDEIPPRGV